MSMAIRAELFPRGTDASSATAQGVRQTEMGPCPEDPHLCWASRFLGFISLLLKDSGQYRAQASFTGGIKFKQIFFLTVYDPAPLPQIMVKSASITPGWHNATLECTASGDTEDLKVTWGSTGLPRGQRITLDPSSHSLTLTLSLSLSQPSASLTCVVSNQVDQKTATLDLGEVCVSDASSAASQVGRQPVMGPCSEDPHLCGASRLLGFTSFLLSVCCTGIKSSAAPGPGVQDSGLVPLQGIRGGSVLFHVTKNRGADPEEVSWGFGPELNYSVMLQVHRGADTPTWVSLQDKYQHRVHVPNILSLRIDNLIPEDSGQYRARASFTRGIELNQVFLLTVYETVPLPKILVKPASFTPGWCNATLECTAPGDTKDLKVTWEIKGLPRELEQTVTSELPSKSWNLTLYLPMSQPSGNLTCMVSNQVDQKTTTLDLGEVCVSDSPGNNGAKTLSGIIGTVVIILLIFVIGLFLWKSCVKKRKMKTGRGVEVQEDQRDNDGGLHYAELSQQESATHKGVDKQHLEEKESSTVYSEVCKPEREAMKIL